MIGKTLAIPAVTAKLVQAKKKVGVRTAPYIERVLRYCWSTAMSPAEIAEGLGIGDRATRSRIQSACKAACAIGLLTLQGEKYLVDMGEVGRLRDLAGKV